MSDRGRDQTETATEEKKSEKDDPGKINALQIAAATGAATTAAVVANALDIYGTVVGVAVISIISSVGSVVYLKSMRHTKDKLDKVVKNRDTIVLRSRTGSVEATVVAAAAPPKAEDPAAPTEPVAKATGTAKVPTVVIPDAEPPSASQRAKQFLKRNWRSIAVSSLIVFVLTVGLLTSLAMLSGQPATSFYDSSPRQSTSSDEPAPSQDEEQSTGDDKPSDDATPSEDESTSPESQEPSSPETTEEPEPSTQDSNPEDDGDGDGDLKPTPSDRGDAASRR